MSSCNNWLKDGGGDEHIAVRWPFGAFMGAKTLQRAFGKKAVFDYMVSGLYEYKELILTRRSPVAFWGIKKF